MSEEEQNTNQSELELKRCISRLSYIGMGLSEELDQALESLRKLIKDNATETQIQEHIDSISKILRTLEDKTSTTNITNSLIEIDFIQLLLQQKIPNKLKSELIAQQKKHEQSQNSQTSNNQNANTQNQADQIAHSIALAIETFVNQLTSSSIINKPPESSEKKSGIFSNFFSKLFKNEEIQPEIQSNSVLPEDLKISLFQMTDQLASIDSYKDIATKLNEQVKQIKSFHELKGILELITESFIDVSGQEHQQFETFLTSLSNRIDRVNEFINNTIIYSKKVEHESIELDTQVQDSISNIKSNLETSSSLIEFKDHLYDKLDSIIKKVSSFRQTQEQSQSQFSRNLQQLEEQLKATEDETLRLKTELADQKIRAQTDSLTRLPNRYSYNERLTQEYNRWRRYRSPLSLIIGDIDHFKKVNDTYGHSAGDQVLKKIAQFLQSELRESDFVARYGGEEFIILLPETNLIDATKAINKLRLGVKEIMVNLDNTTFSVAMSFGVSEFENNDTPMTVFKRADKAIYRAKEKGRDQVCCQRAEPAN